VNTFLVLLLQPLLALLILLAAGAWPDVQLVWAPPAHAAHGLAVAAAAAADATSCCCLCCWLILY
jgi:hypothetical protein